MTAIFGGGGAAGAITQIAQTTTVSSAANITFSSIAGTYTSLLAVMVARGDTAAQSIDFRVQMNGDTGSNYSSEILVASGSTNSSAEALAAASIRIGDLSAASATANYAGGIMILIPNYTQTVFFKPVFSLMSGPKNTTTGGQNVEIASGIWLSTAAITSLKIFPSAGNFVNSSIATLYGIT